jgi:hypothetical protein
MRMLPPQVSQTRTSIAKERLSHCTSYRGSTHWGRG